MISNIDEFEDIVIDAIMSWNWLHHNDDDFVEFDYGFQGDGIDIVVNCNTVDCITFYDCHSDCGSEIIDKVYTKLKYYTNHYGKKKEGSMYISEHKVRDALGFESCDIHDLRGWKIHPVIVGELNIRNMIKKVIFNDPATIILWKGGGKTVVKVGPNETYDPEKGMAMCICKKVLGNKGNFNDVFKKHMGD